MSIPDVTKTSLETSKNLFTSNRAGWGQTAGKVSSFVLSHKGEMFMLTTVLLTVTIGASLFYQYCEGVWPHQVLIANILFPFRNLVPETVKEGMDRYCGKVYPKYKFTEADRTELEGWVNSATDDADKNSRRSVMEKVLAGAKELIDVPVSFLELNLLEKLTHLHYLRVTSNEKVSFPLQIQKLSNLYTLELNNFIIPSGDVWEDFSELDHLKLTNCTFLEGSVMKMPKLVYLNLKNCGLSDFIEFLGVFSLESISIAENGIENLPEEMPKGFDAVLKTLNLSHNKLSSLPKWIGNLKNLIILDISRNKELTELPEEIYQLPKKCTVYINGLDENLHASLLEKMKEEGYSGPKFADRVLV